MDANEVAVSDTYGKSAIWMMHVDKMSLEETWKYIRLLSPSPKLKEVKSLAFGFGYQFDTMMEVGAKSCKATFHVVQGSETNI